MIKGNPSSMKTFMRFLFSICILNTILIIISCSEEENSIPKTITDIDGNVYSTVVIGKQIWIQENLRVTKYRNGDAIENVIDDTEWSMLETGAWCYYTNDSQYDDPYGKLYNSFAITDARRICPKGWHVPSDDEWTALENFLGVGSAGAALKESGTTHWLSPNTGATNSSGFTALPGGYRGGTGVFPFVGIDNLGSHGLWWSSTEFDEENLWIRTMGKDWNGLGRQEGNKWAGLSCRCILD